MNQDLERQINLNLETLEFLVLYLIWQMRRLSK